MKKIILLVALLTLGGCISVGEFTPQRHAQHEAWHPDCVKSPDMCVDGVAW